MDIHERNVHLELILFYQRMNKKEDFVTPMRLREQMLLCCCFGGKVRDDVQLF